VALKTLKNLKLFKNFISAIVASARAYPQLSYRRRIRGIN